MSDCLHWLVERQAAATPDAVALYAQDSGPVSYADLDRRASRLAAVLRARGVGPESLVAVACERSPEMLVALLGIMKAGGAYVPLDLHAPPARLADVLEQCGEPPVVTTARGQAAVPGDRDLIRVDRLTDADPVLDSPTSVDERNLIYVIFTSGSTGRPKGVMTEHRPVVNRLTWMIREHPLGPGDRVLQKTPVHFDVSVWEMFWPLCVGATLVLARPDAHGDADYLVRTIIEQGITVAHFVPSMLYAFLEHPRAGDCRTLGRVFCSGEALPPGLQERYFARMAGRLYNLYGPTEAAIEVSSWTCRPGTPTVPIGHPIDRTRLYVLDEYQQPVADGEPGELVIAGVPVARGYLGRPDLTAEVFLDDPYGPSGDRMYRSGDRVRRRPDGAIEYLERLDDQIKLRGQRIELGEIEACLESHSWVRRAVAAVKSTSETDQRLIGYLVPAPDADPDRLDAVLRTHLAERLPGYMVPASFVTIDTVPVSSTGKTDRRALPDPLHVAAHGSAADKPRPGLESRIAAIWADVLRRPEPGRHDEFLAGGGNSLLATVLAARISYELGAPLTVVQVFAAASLADLAGTVATLPATGPVADFPVARSLDEHRLDRLDEMDPGEIDELLAELEELR